MNKGIMVEKITNYQQLAVDKFKETIFDEQVKYYENTCYYNNYVSCIQNADIFSKGLIEQFRYQCALNTVAFKDPFYQNLKYISRLNIGYQIPEIYIERLITCYQEAFSRNNDIKDSDVEISIVPIEYYKTSENMVKWGCFYKLEIELVDKLKKDKTKVK